MSSTIRNTACLISLLLVIYVMREAHTSPGTFLKNHIVRLAQEQNISERFCGNGYDNIAFSSSEIQTADGYRSSLASMRGDKTLSNFIEEGEPKDTFVKNYGKSFIPYLVPWVVFLGLGIIGCLVCVVNWSCMNCSCLRKRAPSCCTAPKTPKFRNCFVILSVLFMTFTLGAGIAGIVFIANFPKYTHGALCSMVQFLEKVQDGSTEDKWIGLTPGINSLDELYNNITTTVAGLSEYNVLFNEFEQGLNDVFTSVEGLYENNRNQTLPRINPDDNTTYQPYYITELGPSTQNGTVTNQLGTALDQSKQTLEDNRNTLDSFLTNVQTDTDSVLKDISDNRPTLVQANQWLTDALNTFSNHESTINMIIRIINGVLLGVTIANVAVAAIAIISILLVCCGSNFFNKSIHISWCILGLLMIVGFAASTALFGATILVSEACDVGNNALQSSDFFNKTFDRITVYFNVDTSDFNKTREVLYRCVYGDGDLSQEFNLTSNLVYFNDIFSSTNQLYTEFNDQIDALPTTISGSLENNLNLFKEGLVPDSNETITDLETLNALTNSQFNPCTTAADTWLLNSQNCTTSEGTVFADTSASNFNVPQATCIGYNAWSTDPHSITDRYSTAVFSGLGCTSQNDDTFVISYINSLATNRENSNQLIAQLETEIQGIDSNYALFVSDLQKAPQNLQDTNNTVAGIYYSLTDPNNGLIANTNCKFIVSAVDELRDVACTGVGSTFYKLTIALLVLSFVTFFGTLFLFCLAKRFTVKSEGQKVNPELYRVK